MDVVPCDICGRESTQACLMTGSHICDWEACGMVVLLTKNAGRTDEDSIRRRRRQLETLRLCINELIFRDES